MVIRTGKMRYPNTDYATSNYCISYLDILGGANKICNDKNNEFLNLINMIYQDVLKEAELIKLIDRKDIFVKIFSDNILLAIKIDKNDEKRKLKIEKIISFTSNIINEMLRYGCLIRGAIVDGEFFQNELFVYGKAHVQAVKTEENIAVYPRVIVQDKIQKIFPQYCDIAEDGVYYLNHYVKAQTFENITFKMQLLKLLKEANQDVKIKQKVMWAIAHYNKHNKEFIKLGSTQCQLITDEEILNVINGDK